LFCFFTFPLKIKFTVISFTQNKPMLHPDNANFAAILQATQNELLNFWQNIPQQSTQPNATITNQTLPNLGIGAQQTLQQFIQTIKPIISGSTGPRYWGFVTGGATPAAVIGDMLAALYDQNTQRTNMGGDCSALLELQTIKMLLDLFELPHTFTGGFVTGATQSNFTCLATARQWAGQQLGIDVALHGLPQNKVIVLSAEPHSSAIKCLSMMGLGSANIILVKKLAQREAIDVAHLNQLLQQYKNQPVILISSGGTVNTVDFDDMQAIAQLQQQHNFWWHIDAAFGAFAILAPEHKHKLQGWHLADSITIDCHKWLNVPYDSAVYFIQQKHSLLQMETFKNSNAPYLGNPADNFSFMNYLPENSRRFRALPVWFTLMAYGKDGYTQIVQNSINMAQQLGNYITNHPQLVLLAPVRLNCVCFTLQNNPTQVNHFIQQLNQTQQVYVTPTVLNGQAGIRAAFVNWRTTSADVQLVTTLMDTILQ
jgi:glutamate/tyrosine decarboxylase-like PLP-dependent enzyme